jgi:hypothetical protein
MPTLPVQAVHEPSTTDGAAPKETLAAHAAPASVPSAVQVPAL